MTYTPPTMTLEVALTSTPYEWFDDIVAWTDMSDRLLSWSTSRGRQDQLAAFEPGTLTCVLNNDDNLLDPDNPDGLVYRGDGVGLPLCPVRLTASFGGTDYTMFAGYIGPECWVVEAAPNGQVSTVRLDAVDTLGWWNLVDCMSSPWATHVASMEPDLWVRGDSSTDPAMGDGYELTPRNLIVGGHVTTADSGSGEMVWPVESMTPGDSTSAFYCQQGARIIADSTSLFSVDATTSAFTASVIWRGHPAVWNQNVIRLQTSGGSPRFVVECQTTGAIVLIMYNNSGSAVSFHAAPDNTADGSGGRWDDGNPHLVTVRYNGSSLMGVMVDGLYYPLTSSVPASYTTSGLRLIVGTSAAAVSVSELMFWNSLVSYSDVQSLHASFLGDLAFLAGTTADTIPLIAAQVAGVPYGYPAMEIFMTEPTPFSWGLGSVVPMPATLGDLMRAWAEAFGGATYALKTGTLRLRDGTVLATGDFGPYYHDDEFVTIQGIFTNAASLSGGRMRRGYVQRTGVRMDRIVNSVSGTVGTGSDLDTKPERTGAYVRKDPTSIARYGERTYSFTSNAQDTTYAAAIAEDILARFAEPPIEVGDVPLFPIGDDDVTAFVLGIELEQMVTIEDVPPGAFVFTGWTADLNVQHITHAWERGLDWTVTLNLAQS